LLCDRRVDRIIHYDTYDAARHTNERAMIDALERATVDDVHLRPVASGTGWKVDAVERAGCASAPRSATADEVPRSRVDGA
jgi:hypothetical protein